MKEFFKKFFQTGKKAIEDDYFDNIIEKKKISQEHHGEIEKKIQILLDKYVKPAVTKDGGNIAFREFDNGTVKVELQGACSGCPSATITLKNGIEALLKKMIPEVEEVVAV